jgi:hypothetical protein
VEQKESILQGEPRAGARAQAASVPEYQSENGNSNNNGSNEGEGVELDANRYRQVPTVAVVREEPPAANATVDTPDTDANATVAADPAAEAKELRSRIETWERLKKEGSHGAERADRHIAPLVVALIARRF